MAAPSIKYFGGIEQDNLGNCQISGRTLHASMQAVTTCGLSSLASFHKILSSKRVCCVFRDIRDKNAVNQGFWSKTLQAFKK